MPEPQDHDQSAEEPHRRRPRIDWQWIISVLGLTLAVMVVFVTPAMPYKINNAASGVLLIAALGAIVWFAYKVRQRRQTPASPGRRGVWVAGMTAAALVGLSILNVVPQEETGYIKAYCTPGLWGFGHGMVQIKIEPEEKGVPYRVVVRWGDWVGEQQPSPVLTETTYFTLLKRNWHSEPFSVSVSPPAKITCGDGRPSSDRPIIHLDGEDWTRRPKIGPSTPLSTAPVRPSSPLANQVNDHDDPTGCSKDARRAHEQPVFAPDGMRIGALQLTNSVNCKAMWGRFEVVADAQPPGGWKITLTVMRTGDGQTDTFERQTRTTAFYTGLLRDDGSCFRVHLTVVVGSDPVVAKTPCLR